MEIGELVICLRPFHLSIPGELWRRSEAQGSSGVYTSCSKIHQHTGSSLHFSIITEDVFFSPHWFTVLKDERWLFCLWLFKKPNETYLYFQETFSIWAVFCFLKRKPNHHISQIKAVITHAGSKKSKRRKKRNVLLSFTFRGGNRRRRNHSNLTANSSGD